MTAAVLWLTFGRESGAAQSVAAKWDGHNAFVFQKVFAAEGFYALKERRPIERASDRLGKVVGLLVVEERSMRFLVSWPLGIGRRATYSAIVSKIESNRYILSGIRYDGNAPPSVAYDLDRYRLGSYELEDKSLSPFSTQIDSPPLSSFTLESAPFTDFWERIQ